MKDIGFYTIVSDTYFYPAGAHILVNSFRYFHPDIDLVVFRQDVIDKVMSDGKINFYNAKPTFAKLLTDKYKLVVNIDCDTVIMGRLDAVIDGDYEVGGPTNVNEYENASFENITPEMYVQAGMVASRNPKFWDIWEEKNKFSDLYLRRENDTLNLVWYNDPEVQKMNRVIWDKEKDYYGCKSLGREPDFYMEGKKVMLDGQVVKCYHHAKGRDFPKLDFDRMPFQQDVKDYLKHVSTYGQSVCIGRIQ